MEIDRLYPFECEKKYYFYDSETGIVSESQQIINKIIDKINKGYDKKNIIESFKYEDAIKDIEGIYLELDEYITNKFNITEKYKKNLVRMPKKTSEQDWYNGKVVKNLWLSLTNICNMKCAYCFETNKLNVDEAIMSKDIAKQCIDFFFKYFRKDSEKVNVNFFGGEPLLNKEVFIYATNYINEKISKLGVDVSYILTTNGTIIDKDILDTIVKNNIELNISIDGDRGTHNLNRKFLNGETTFDLVKSNIKKILKVYDNITARITLTKPAISNFKDDVMCLWNMGISYIYIDPVVTENKELQLGNDLLNIFEKQLDEIVEIMKKEKVINNNIKIINNLFYIANCISNRTIQSECSLYNPDTMIFMPEGDIYKCSFTFGNKEHCIGNIHEGIVWSKAKKTFNPNKKCLTCWAKRLCGGSCPIREISDSMCKYKKIMIKNSLKLYAYSSNGDVIHA